EYARKRVREIRVGVPFRPLPGLSASSPIAEDEPVASGEDPLTPSASGPEDESHGNARRGSRENAPCTALCIPARDSCLACCKDQPRSCVHACRQEYEFCVRGCF